MDNPLIQIALMMSFLPLAGALAAGLFGAKLGRTLTHRIAVGAVGIAFLLSAILFKQLVLQGEPSVEGTFYTWATAGVMHFDIAFLVDRLSASMCFVVLFISLMVHIYTIGYMQDDPGYTRFFAYVSLFTFAMLMLVLANNFLLLFFGWEGVGLVSYLLIGFWFKRDSATAGGLKAFIVNRVGDVGFILATGGILMTFGTLNYQEVFHQVPTYLDKALPLIGSFSVPMISGVCFLLFIGAMGKSAQVPLHVWLPESMEGPTPISALIHAATMVTAGIYMVARLSPMFEYAPGVLSFILVIGGTTAFFMGLLAITQNDIKRVIAYSTLSQLGYMTVALGASAYDAAIFHLITHAFFKALLFLAAGSVIIAVHHEQDMRKMGGLVRYLPITYITFMIGSLALCAIPPFAGFYSKDVIIEAVHLSTLPGAHYAYWCVLAGAFVTPLYTFRALFMTFHTDERTDLSVRSHIKEASWVVWVPLVLLAIPSLMAGQVLVNPMLFSSSTLLGDTIFVLPDHNVLLPLRMDFPGAARMALEAGRTLTFWLAMSGIVTAWFFTVFKPAFASVLAKRFSWIYAALVNKFGFDAFNQRVFVKGTKDTAQVFYEVGDVKCIDGFFVNGSGRVIRLIASTAKRLQTGYIYHYAFVMVLGMVGFLLWSLGGF